MKKLSLTIKDVMLIISMLGLNTVHAAPSSHGTLPVQQWTGFYTGVHAAYVVNHIQLHAQQLGLTSPNAHCDRHEYADSFFPGIQLGYMGSLMANFVSSIEANINFNTQAKYKLACRCQFNPQVSDRFNFRNSMQSFIMGRLGRVISWYNNPLLPYFTLGASFVNVALSYHNEGGDHDARNVSQAGWLIGAGIEWAFKPHWSLRTDYYYTDDGHNTITLKLPSVYGLVDPHGHARASLSAQHISLALNYWL